MGKLGSFPVWFISGLYRKWDKIFREIVEDEDLDED
jgi:hypothetical protein